MLRDLSLEEIKELHLRNEEIAIDERLGRVDVGRLAFAFALRALLFALAFVTYF